jgi:hypothetical protein
MSVPALPVEEISAGSIGRSWLLLKIGMGLEGNYLKRQRILSQTVPASFTL